MVIAVVLVVVLALVVAGMLAWLVWRDSHEGGNTSGPFVHPSASASLPAGSPSPLPPAVPFDALRGLGNPVTVTTLGTWDGVAVFDMTYQVTGLTADQGSYNVYRDSFRGVSTSTGKVLWTLDKLPDGSAFRSQQQPGKVSAGNFAVALQAVGADKSSGDNRTYCPGLTYVAVISLQTGKASYGKPLAAFCKLSGTKMGWASELVMAYEAGIVVVDQYTSVSYNDSDYPRVSKTVAYRDSDLATPIWQVLGTMKLDSSAPTIFELAQQWVLAASGEFVSITDGTTSNFKYPDGQAVTDVDGIIVVSKPGSLKAWTSPAEQDPVWESDGAGLALSAHSLPLECSTPDVIVVAGASGGMVGVGLKDGQQLWQMAASDKAGCIGLRNGSQEIVGLRDGGTFQLLDAFTGAVLSHQDGFGPKDGSSMPMLCGSGMVCVIDGSSAKKEITGSDYSTGTLGTPWTIEVDNTDAGHKVDTSGMDRVYQMYGHLVLIFHDAHGWNFMTV